MLLKMKEKKKTSAKGEVSDRLPYEPPRITRREALSAEGEVPDDRLPYEQPRIIYREPLEVVATACVPAPPSSS